MKANVVDNGKKERGRRLDAVRNREHLLSSAATTYLNEGSRVTMHTIARKAGVGVGTLYRHFPDRSALLAALRERAYGVVLRSAQTARASMTDNPLLAIRNFLFAIIATRDMIVLPFTGAPPAALGADMRARQAIAEELESILGEGQRTGLIRPDINALDIMIAGAHLARRLPNLPDEPAAARRQAQIFVDGLRPSPEPLREGATKLEDLEASWRTKTH